MHCELCTSHNRICRLIEQEVTTCRQSNLICVVRVSPHKVLKYVTVRLMHLIRQLDA